MKKASLIALAYFGTIFIAGFAAAQPPVAVTTYHYDNLRTGWNNNEASLTATSFPSNFGILNTVTLDDQVDAQPLFVPGLTIAGGTHDVVYVGTESDTVYAIDASTGTILKSNHLGLPIPHPQSCFNNGPRAGIMGTPVIDQVSQSLYVMAYVQLSGIPTYQLHKLDLITLLDKVPAVTVTAAHTLNNNQTFKFDASVQRQRAALLEQNGNIYVAFGSYCDFKASSSRGWLLGWTADTLAPLAANQLDDTQVTSPTNFFLASIWMSGYGIAGSGPPNNDLFFSTGNSDCDIYAKPEKCPPTSTYDGKTNIQESLVRLSGDLTNILGIFTPSNVLTLDRGDTDVGSGGVLLLPQPSSPLLAVASGKDGNLRLLSRPTTSGLTLLDTHHISACWCGPSFFIGPDGISRVVTGQGKLLHTWQVNVSPSPNLGASSEGTSNVTTGQDPGFFTVVSSKSSDGTSYGKAVSGTAIIWAVGRPTGNPPTVNLEAFAALAVNKTFKLLFSKPAGSWPNVGGNANIVPVVANGKVYVASSFRTPLGDTCGQLNIFGIGGTGVPITTGNCPRTPGIAPLQRPSLHVISGTLLRVSGSILTLTKRNGASAIIDASQASQNERIGAPLDIGTPLTVQGSSIIPTTGALLADSIVRAKGTTGDLWPPDL